MHRATNVFLLIVLSFSGLVGCPRQWEAPVVAVSTTDVSFPVGEDTSSLYVWNAAESRCGLEFQALADRAWIQVEPSAGESTGPQDPAELVLHVDRSALTEKDRHDGTVTVVSNGGEKVIYVSVEVGPRPSPALSVSTTSLDFAAVDDVRTFFVWDSGEAGSALDFRVLADQAWVHVAPATGSSTGPTDAIAIAVTLDLATLPDWADAATITVLSNGGSASISVGIPSDRTRWQPVVIVGRSVNNIGEAFARPGTASGTLSLPVELDLRDRVSLMLGRKDRNNEDMNAVAPVLGDFLGTGYVHTLILRVAQPGMYSLRYHFCDREAVYCPGAVELKAVTLTRLRVAPGEWSIDLFVRESPALLLLDVIRRPDEPAPPGIGIDAIEVNFLGNTLDMGSAPNPPTLPISEPISTPIEAQDSVPAGDPADYPINSLATAFCQPEETAADASFYLELEPGEDVPLLDSHLTKVFGAPVPVPRPSDLDIVMKLHLYISEVMPTQVHTWNPPVEKHTATYAFARSTASCYDCSVAFTELCRRMGLPARVVNFWGTARGGHSTAEVFYDGAWHFCDPEFSSFFYTRDTYDRLGVIPSIRQLRADSSLLQYCFMLAPVSALGTGTYQVGYPIAPFPDDWRWGAGEPYTAIDELRGYILNAYPVEMRPSATSCSEPLELDFAQTTSVTVGQVDSSMWDITGYTARNMTAFWIGRWDNSTGFHTLLLKNARPGPYRITYAFVNLPLESRSTPGVIPLKGAAVTGISVSPKQWTIECDVYMPEAVVLLDLLAKAQGYCGVVDCIQVEFVGE